MADETLMVDQGSVGETFEKCSILFKVKEVENLNPPDFHRDSQEYTFSISRMKN